MAFFAISDQYATFIFFILWPKITFYRISRHFRSIRNFFFPAAILDDRKSLSIAFLAISDQCATFIVFTIGWPNITFDRISRLFRSIHNFFFTKWLPTAILDDRKITFECISRHFRSIRNFFFEFFSKWPPAVILDVRFAPKTIGFFHYYQWLCQIMKFICEFMTQLESHKLFEHFYTKWPPEAILFSRLMPKIIRIL